jgi:hypothetical protein
VISLNLPAALLASRRRRSCGRQLARSTDARLDASEGALKPTIIPDGLLDVSITGQQAPVDFLGIAPNHGFNHA